ncbi:MAG: hypothetical protein EA397_17850 [Deltaproteobacteria bacterium]|nr:MAG: hypothetical protein EA397_17850 [Deltaproteobacteria bacterium]
MITSTCFPATAFDLTGDGLRDLVRIRRTSVEYWPRSRPDESAGYASAGSICGRRPRSAIRST